MLSNQIFLSLFGISLQLHAFLSSVAVQNKEMIKSTEDLFKGKWSAYKALYKLDFNETEETRRFGIYQDNMMFVYRHNAQNYSFELGETPFTHWTQEEYVAWRLDPNPKTFPPVNATLGHSNQTGPDIPDKDWRKDNKVTPVRNQSGCECGYAFAALGAVESLIAIKQNKLVELSKQELLDCSTGYGNRGCSGGSTVNSLKYLKDVGIYTDLAYPYMAKQGTCKRPSLPVNTPVKISGLTMIPSGDEKALATAVSKVTPVAVSIDASLKTFQLYKSGVYYDPACNSTSVNHAVLVVGVGSTPSANYIIKNSWGTAWGMDGYMLIARNQKNQCGIAFQGVHPTI